LSTAIRLENVSKRFTLHQRRAQSFQDLVVGMFQRDNKTLVGPESEPDGDFWALRDVSFSVEEGETVGVIGPNGAGKSTLLKLISRIIEPTSGEIEVNGRVGALLELGAGFHTDLTGRENIYLNGSILGLSRAEIETRMDEIIAFAELERFIDMPVKHYSSGMHMRLGFSVAVHTDPKILLVDEVLAVGDENFQHKCLDRIMDLRREGITICFVSHGLGQVRRLCSRAIWLDHGTIQAEGGVDDAVSAYLRHAATEEESMMGKPGTLGRRATSRQRASAAGSGDAREDKRLEIMDVSFLDGTGDERQVFRVGEPWVVRLRYRALDRMERPVFGITVHRNDGLRVCDSNTLSAGLSIPSVEGDGDIFYRITQLPLMEGTYFLSASVQSSADAIVYDKHDRLHTFKVRQVGRGERYGLISLGGRWDWDADQQSLSAKPRSASEMPVQTRGSDPIAERRWGTNDIEITDVALLDAAGVRRRVFEAGEPWMARLYYRARRRVDNPVFGLAIHREGNLHICGPNTHFAGLGIPFIEDEGHVSYRVDRLPLTAGTYYLTVSAHDLADTVMYDYQDRLYVFKVCQFGADENVGVVSLGAEWNWNEAGKDV